MSHNGKYYVHKLKAKEENSKDIRAMFKTAKKPRLITMKCFVIPEEYDTKCLWEDVKADTIMEEVYPNIRVLLRLLMLFPLSAAVVERLFSKLKIVKNRLRNRLGDLTLSKLLTVCTESPKDGFSDQDYERTKARQPCYESEGFIVVTRTISAWSIN